MEIDVRLPVDSNEDRDVNDVPAGEGAPAPASGSAEVPVNTEVLTGTSWLIFVLLLHTIIYLIVKVWFNDTWNWVYWVIYATGFEWFIGSFGACIMQIVYRQRGSRLTGFEFSHIDSSNRVIFKLFYQKWRNKDPIEIFCLISIAALSFTALCYTGYMALYVYFRYTLIRYALLFATMILINRSVVDGQPITRTDATHFIQFMLVVLDLVKRVMQ